MIAQPVASRSDERSNTRLVDDQGAPMYIGLGTILLIIIIVLLLRRR